MAAEHSDATVIPLPTAAKRKVKQGGIRAARVYRQQYPWRGLYVPPPLRAAMEEFKKSGGTTIKPDDDTVGTAIALCCLIAIDKYAKVRALRAIRSMAQSIPRETIQRALAISEQLVGKYESVVSEETSPSQD